MNMATYIKRHGNPGPNVTYCQGCNRYVPAGLIAGGESGPGARPCHPDWIREVDGGLRPSAAYLEAREDLEQYKRDLPEFERLCGWK